MEPVKPRFLYNDKFNSVSDSTNNNNNNNEPDAAVDAIRGGKKVYTEAEISELLSEGYINVHEDLWDRIPTGSHVRYFRKDDGSGLEKWKRFKLGGFVSAHVTNAGGEKMLKIESILGGNKKQAGYFTFLLKYKDIEEIWKKYDHSAFIEIHLIQASLAKKKTEIEELKSYIRELSLKIVALEEKVAGK